MDDFSDGSAGKLKPTARRRERSIAAQSTEASLLQEILWKLDRIAAVLASQGKTVDKQIDILSAAGCDSVFIGMVVGMEPGAVRTRQSRVRAKVVKSKAAAPTQSEPGSP